MDELVNNNPYKRLDDSHGESSNSRKIPNLNEDRIPCRGGKPKKNVDKNIIDSLHKAHKSREKVDHDEPNLKPDRKSVEYSHDFEFLGDSMPLDVFDDDVSLIESDFHEPANPDEDALIDALTANFEKPIQPLLARISKIPDFVMDIKPNGFYRLDLADTSGWQNYQSLREWVYEFMTGALLQSKWERGHRPPPEQVAQAMDYGFRDMYHVFKSFRHWKPNFDMMFPHPIVKLESVEKNLSLITTTRVRVILGTFDTEGILERGFTNKVDMDKFNRHVSMVGKIFTLLMAQETFKDKFFLLNSKKTQINVLHGFLKDYIMQPLSLLNPTKTSNKVDFDEHDIEKIKALIVEVIDLWERNMQELVSRDRLDVNENDLTRIVIPNCTYPEDGWTWEQLEGIDS